MHAVLWRSRLGQGPEKAPRAGLDTVMDTVLPLHPCHQRPHSQAKKGAKDANNRKKMKVKIMLALLEICRRNALVRLMTVLECPRPGRVVLQQWQPWQAWQPGPRLLSRPRQIHSARLRDQSQSGAASGLTTQRMQAGCTRMLADAHTGDVVVAGRTIYPGPRNIDNECKRLSNVLQ